MQEHGNMDIDQQKGSYNGFVKLFTWSTILIIVGLSIMAATLL
jgi:Bacterial aa3 type cytochrome c oxidase subunit IV